MNRRITPTVVALAVLVARGAAGQEPVEMRVVAAGMTAAGVEVFVLVQGEPFRLGATDAEGRVTAPADLVGLSTGDPVEVRQVVCGEGRSLLLVPRGENAGRECARREREDASCACDRLGVLRWGSDVAIDLVAEPPPAPRGPPRPPQRWVVAAGAGFSSWPNLDLGCQTSPSPVACRLEAERPTLRAAAEFRPRWRLPLSFLGAVGYTPDLVVDQVFGESDNPRDPRRNRVELDVTTFEGYAAARQAVSSVDLFLALGYVWSYDRVNAVTTLGASDLSAEDQRADSGGRLGGRAGLDWWSAGRDWGARLEIGGMTGKRNDIDASWSAVAMVLVPVGER